MMQIILQLFKVFLVKVDGPTICMIASSFPEKQRKKKKLLKTAQNTFNKICIADNVTRLVESKFLKAYPTKSLLYS